MEIVSIEEILPHRKPMLLVDRVVSCEVGYSLSAVKKVIQSDLRVTEGIATNTEIYPYSLLMESFGQAAAILLIKTLGTGMSRDDVLFFGSMRNFELYSNAFVGDILEVDIVLNSLVGNTMVVSGEVTVEDRKIAVIDSVTLGIRHSDLLMREK